MSFAAKLFSFQGRIGRADWWLLSLLIGAVQMALFFAIFFGMWSAEEASAADALKKPAGPSAAMLLGWFVVPALVGLWPSLAVQVKRWHDRDKGAVWLLINFIPWLGPLWAFVELGFLPGTSGANRFGAGPGLGEERVADVFGDEDLGPEHDRAAQAIARWQAEQRQTAAAPAPDRWAAMPAAGRPATAAGFGRRAAQPGFR